jgi:hypothetical protein
MFLIQVAEDQKLLRERIQYLGGEAGIGRMESALSETRSKFFQAKENRSSIATTVANVTSPSVTCSSGQSNVSETGENSNMDAEKTSRIVKSLFGASSSRYESSKGGKLMSNAAPEKMPTENEQIVNEILHNTHGSFADISDGTGTVEGDFKVSYNLNVKFSSTNNIKFAMYIIKVIIISFEGFLGN